jgi:hypothetical protein
MVGNRHGGAGEPGNWGLGEIEGTRGTRGTRETRKLGELGKLGN